MGMDAFGGDETIIMIAFITLPQLYPTINLGISEGVEGGRGRE
jgi:hypothetical protein